jgi:hypothetical protein
LLQLADSGLVEMLKIGRAYHFRAPDDLKQRIERR